MSKERHSNKEDKTPASSTKREKRAAKKSKREEGSRVTTLVEK